MRIRDALGGDRHVFSFEFFPPKTDDGVHALFNTVKDLAPLKPTFVSVTYGAGGGTRDVTIDLVSRIKSEIGVEAMAHLTCVGHSASEIDAILESLKSRGIENVLPLRGDPPRGETQFVRPSDGFGFAQELVRFIKKRYSFCLAGACYPEVHPQAPDFETDVDHLKEKVDSGVDFLVTQLFFDPDHYFRFVERVRAKGIDVPILPGVMPVTNVSQIERFTSVIGASIPTRLHDLLEPLRDDEEAVIEAGIDWATEQASRLLAGGAPGIHFFTLNRSLSSRRIYENLNG